MWEIRIIIHQIGLVDPPYWRWDHPHLPHHNTPQCGSPPSSTNSAYSDNLTRVGLFLTHVYVRPLNNKNTENPSQTLTSSEKLVVPLDFERLVIVLFGVIYQHFFFPVAICMPLYGHSLRKTRPSRVTLSA